MAPVGVVMMIMSATIDRAQMRRLITGAHGYQKSAAMFRLGLEALSVQPAWIARLGPFLQR
jgi:hypothetical protein